MTFWLNTSSFGKVTAYVDGVIQGDIGSFFRSQPSCGSSGTLSFKATVGRHKYRVVSRKNKVWEGEFTVNSSGCVRVELGD